MYLEVYGCTANKSDASIIKGILQSKGHRFVKETEDAEVVIILTCTVIGSTEQRMLSRIKKLSRLGKTLIVSGCMAAVQPDLVWEITSDAILLPPSKVSAVADVVGGKKLCCEYTVKTSLPRCYEGVVAHIAISEGCDFSCSYCITTKARGKLISYSIEEVVATVHDAIRKGCREIQLTSQDTASYGSDTGESLSELIKRVSEINRCFRIRVGMMNPYTALRQVDELLDAYENHKVYKFLHLPVQSGDNRVLQRMNRRYTVEEFVGIIDLFRSRFPNVTVSTDVIVGFPGEDEEGFKETMNLLKEAEPDIVNITRFSPRPYTEAKKLTDRVPTAVAKQRSRVLTTLCKEIAEKKNKLFLGRKYNVLITEKGKESTMVGRTINYKPVVIPSQVQLGSIIPVKIVETTANYLIGKLI